MTKCMTWGAYIAVGRIGIGPEGGPSCKFWNVTPEKMLKIYLEICAFRPF